MDESLFEGTAVARFDQARADAADWGRALCEMRARLCAGGFTSGEAYRLSRLWFDQHLCNQLTQTMFGDSYLD